jgi:hypothetical protein
MSMRALLFLLLAGCATTRMANESPSPPHVTSSEQERLLTTLFDAAAHKDWSRLKSLVDWSRYQRVQTWDMARMGLAFLFVGQLGEEPTAAWFDIALADLCKRLGYVAPGGVQPTAEPSHILDELHHVQSDPSYARAVDKTREVLEGAQEVTYRGRDGSTLTLLLVGNRLAGLIGTPLQRSNAQ